MHLLNDIIVIQRVPELWIFSHQNASNKLHSIILHNDSLHYRHGANSYANIMLNVFVAHSSCFPTTFTTNMFKHTEFITFVFLIENTKHIHHNDNIQIKQEFLCINLVRVLHNYLYIKLSMLAWYFKNC